MIPTPLCQGARLGLIAPASPIYEQENQQAAVQLLEEMGFYVKCYESVGAQRGYLSGSDIIRAGDLMDAFQDPAIDGVVCLRGGYGAARLLPLLDFDVIRRSPKPFVGFSDITALHLAFYAKTGLCTFHGPMPGAQSLSGLREPRSRRMWLEALANRLPARLANPNGESFQRFSGGGAAEGILLGGNLTVLCSLIGTPYLPDFQGKLLLLEDVGERPYRIDGMLNHLRACGILGAVKGILLGDFTQCEEDASRPSLVLEEIFRELLPGDIPILWNVHAGHGQDKMTLPLGRTYRLDGDRAELSLLDKFSNE